MAVHKVPQDVEADDKFLGPLSFKQFVFAGVALICGYLTFLTMTRGIWFISIIFILPFLAFAALAFPWSREQPTDLWLASRIRFLIKPRKRIWDQSGMKQLVKVTAPIRHAQNYSDGLSQTEVRSRLSALATMVDSRGWAVKNVTGSVDSDRLVEAPTVQPSEIQLAADSMPDIMDESNGTIAKQFETMIERSTREQKSQTLKLVEQARQQNGPQPDAVGPLANPSAKNQQDFWFMHTPPAPVDPTLTTFQSTNVVQPGVPSSSPSQPIVANDDTQLDEQALLEKAREKQRRDALQTHSRHEKNIDPNGQAPAISPSESTPQKPVNEPVNPDILELAKSNDLNIETLARQAKKQDDDGEVVISLR